MKFGIFDHLDQRGEPLKKFFEDRLELAAAVEAAGFYSYHVAEHHGTPLGMAPSPNVFLSALARETRTLRFGPLVYLLPLYHPVRLIEEICMLDNLSGGRLDVGVGRGVSPYEVACYGLDPKNTREMFEESLDLILRGLQTDHLDYQGKWYKVGDMPIELHPLQKPYPPLWYGVANDAGVKFCAERGMNFTTLGGTERIKGLCQSFVRLWEEMRGSPHRRGNPVETPLIGVGRHIFIADSDAEAERFARPAYEHWYTSLAALWTRHGSAPQTGMIIPTYGAARSQGQVVAGTPDTVRNELAAQIKDVGFNYLIVQVAWGTFTHEQEMRSFNLFTKEVMPALAKL
jgi:alkanesulfonate monooxygenase SsuD/methylene tetrahydromethanopterin reductase-like flavin-dependent oxidoreductase (luciferase family)